MRREITIELPPSEFLEMVTEKFDRDFFDIGQAGKREVIDISKGSVPPRYVITLREYPPTAEDDE